jgi:hypothetical protein
MVVDEVAKFVTRLAPEPVCDDCIAQRLQLSIRQDVNRKTRELAGTGGFERRKADCSLCGCQTLVIRRN